jgi:hypothetical protein
MDVAPMGVAVAPIFEPLEWGRGGLRRARCRIIATATVEIYAAALIVSATAAVAFLESDTIATIIGNGNMTTANWLFLLALALLLATTAATCSTVQAVLLL